MNRLLTRYRFLAVTSLAAILAAGCSGSGTAPLPPVAPTQPSLSVQADSARTFFQPSSVPTFTVTGIVAGVAPSYFLVRTVVPLRCGYLHVYFNRYTQYPNGKPLIGNSVTAAGSGSCSTSISASNVTVNSGRPSPGGSFSVSGTVTSVDTGRFTIRSTQCGYLHVNVVSSTRYVNGTPSVGSNITVVGSGSCSTSVSASQITVNTGTVSGGSFSVTGKVMDSSTAYAARRTTSVPSGYYLVASTNCGYLHVNVSASTQYPHGVPKAGDNVTATGSGSCSTSVNASIVQDNSGSGGATPSPTSAPTSSPTSAPTSAPTNAPTPSPTSAPTPSGSHTFDHITVIIMENYGYPNIIGQSSAPYENALAKRTLLFTNSHGVSHPSEPNYLALFSGSTQGLTSDACPVNYSGSNLATELASAGYSFEGYAEDMPSPVSACEGSSSPYTSGYYYMRKHVPWADFSNVSTSDYHGWSSGESPSGSVNFIVPNMCDDMHDCGVAPGDSWLAKNVPAIESWDASHNGLLIVTFDEAEYGSTNQIYTVFDGPSIPAGTSSQYVNHYSVLRYIEDNFGVPRLGSAASASPISIP